MFHLSSYFFLFTLQVFILQELTSKQIDALFFFLLFYHLHIILDLFLLQHVLYILFM